MRLFNWGFVRAILVLFIYRVSLLSYWRFLMIRYEFIWRRLDQVECSDGWMLLKTWLMGYGMLILRSLDKRIQPSMIYAKLYHELESVADDNGIPF